ncbi:MAG: hypothetical protein ACK5II_06430 [Paracoccus sp. (in: a-proteobacteria)]
MFETLIWIGSALTLAGLAGIVWCIWTVYKTRRAGLDEAAFRDRMQHVVMVNMCALIASVLGLMAVITGIMLGQ